MILAKDFKRKELVDTCTPTFFCEAGEISSPLRSSEHDHETVMIGLPAQQDDEAVMIGLPAQQDDEAVMIGHPRLISHPRLINSGMICHSS